MCIFLCVSFPLFFGGVRNVCFSKVAETRWWFLPQIPRLFRMKKGMECVIPSRTMSHPIHGNGIFSHPWVVDFYGQSSKYTVRPMDPLGVFPTFANHSNSIVSIRASDGGYHIYHPPPSRFPSHIFFKGAWWRVEFKSGPPKLVNYPPKV